jgi:hypothetical protein
MAKNKITKINNNNNKVKIGDFKMRFNDYMEQDLNEMAAGPNKFNNNKSELNDIVEDIVDELESELDDKIKSGDVETQDDFVKSSKFIFFNREKYTEEFIVVSEHMELIDEIKKEHRDKVKKETQQVLDKKYKKSGWKTAKSIVWVDGEFVGTTIILSKEKLDNTMVTKILSKYG